MLKAFLLLVDCIPFLPSSEFGVSNSSKQQPRVVQCSLKSHVIAANAQALGAFAKPLFCRFCFGNSEQ